MVWCTPPRKSITSYVHCSFLACSHYPDLPSPQSYLKLTYLLLICWISAWFNSNFSAEWLIYGTFTRILSCRPTKCCTSFFGLWQFLSRLFTYLHSDGARNSNGVPSFVHSHLYQFMQLPFINPCTCTTHKSCIPHSCGYAKWMGGPVTNGWLHAKVNYPEKRLHEGIKYLSSAWKTGNNDNSNTCLSY